MKVVITGCGRSGTQWMANVLSFLGLRVRHENAFRSDSQVHLWGDWDFEVSWCAAPFLQELADDIAVFHQVRNPLRVFLCWKTHRLLRNDCDSGTFVHKTLPECNQGTDEERTIQYITHWNDLIERERPNTFYARYQAETLTPQELSYLLDLAGHSISITEINKALDPAIIPRTTGSCYHSKEEIAACTWDSLHHLPGFGAFKAQALRYGYQL